MCCTCVCSFFSLRLLTTCGHVVYVVSSACIMFDSTLYLQSTRRVLRQPNARFRRLNWLQIISRLCNVQRHIITIYARKTVAKNNVIDTSATRRFSTICVLILKHRQSENYSARKSIILKTDSIMIVGYKCRYLWTSLVYYNILKPPETDFVWEKTWQNHSFIW